jgi:cytochrome c oxidase subunit 2
MPDFSNLLNGASTIAGQIDVLFLFLIGLSLLFAVPIGVLIVYFALKYHRRSEDEIPEQFIGSTKLEVAWTVVPLGLAMIVFFWSANIYLHMQQPPDNSEQVFVVAKQWMWRIEHSNGQQEINELHVPIGRPIKLTMTSQDVIHSFYVPEFRIKQDVLPGRYTTTWFQATQPGTYHLFCAEYCGTDHAGMIGGVIAMTPQDYQAWLTGSRAGESPQAAGARLFQQLGCNQCHGNANRAPSLQGVFGKPVQLQNGETILADENYIRESILNPNAKVVAGYEPIMPAFQGQLNEDQLHQLVEYIKSLGAQAPGASPTP